MLSHEDAAKLWKEVADESEKVHLKVLSAAIRDSYSIYGTALETIECCLAADDDGMVHVKQFDDFCSQDGLNATVMRVQEEVRVMLQKFSVAL